MFLNPITQDFGVGRETGSLPVSILLFTFSIFMVVGGLFEKKFGSRITAFGGGVLVCLGWILSYAASSMEWLYVTYGLLVGMGTGLCYLASISTAIKWFPDKKGFASGVVVFGFGFGSAFLAPLAVRLIEGYGWRITMLIYGIAFGMIIMSASRLLKTPPQNWNPEGAMPEKKLANTNIFTDFSPAEMVATGAFKVIFLTYFFAMVAGMMAIGHIAAFVEDCGYSTIQAAFGITILSIFNGIGRVAAGSISDRIGRKSVLIILFFIIGLAVFLFNMELTLYLIYLNAAIIGFCFGGFLAVYPPLTADYFGAKNFGVNYGLVFVGYGAGCFVGPWLGGYIYDISGLYRWAFSLAGGLAIMGGIIIYFLLKSQELKKEVVT